MPRQKIDHSQFFDHQESNPKKVSQSVLSTNPKQEFNQKNTSQKQQEENLVNNSGDSRDLKNLRKKMLGISISKANIEPEQSVDNIIEKRSSAKGQQKLSQEKTDKKVSSSISSLERKQLITFANPSHEKLVQEEVHLDSKIIKHHENSVVDIKLNDSQNSLISESRKNLKNSQKVGEKGLENDAKSSTSKIAPTSSIRPPRISQAESSLSKNNSNQPPRSRSKSTQRQHKIQIYRHHILDAEKPEQFLAYSMVQKQSNFGMFSNNRLLLLNSAERKLSYFSKYPNHLPVQQDEIEQFYTNYPPKQSVSFDSVKKFTFVPVRNNIGQINVTYIENGQRKQWKLFMGNNSMVHEWIELVNEVYKKEHYEEVKQNLKYPPKPKEKSKSKISKYQTDFTKTLKAQVVPAIHEMASSKLMKNSNLSTSNKNSRIGGNVQGSQTSSPPKEQKKYIVQKSKFLSTKDYLIDLQDAKQDDILYELPKNSFIQEEMKPISMQKKSQHPKQLQQSAIENTITADKNKFIETPNANSTFSQALRKQEQNMGQVHQDRVRNLKDSFHQKIDSPQKNLLKFSNNNQKLEQNEGTPLPNPNLRGFTNIPDSPTSQAFSKIKLPSESNKNLGERTTHKDLNLDIAIDSNLYRKSAKIEDSSRRSYTQNRQRGKTATAADQRKQPQQRNSFLSQSFMGPSSTISQTPNQNYNQNPYNTQSHYPHHSKHTESRLITTPRSSDSISNHYHSKSLLASANYSPEWLCMWLESSSVREKLQIYSQFIQRCQQTAKQLIDHPLKYVKYSLHSANNRLKQQQQTQPYDIKSNNTFEFSVENISFQIQNKVQLPHGIEQYSSFVDFIKSENFYQNVLSVENALLEQYQAIELIYRQMSEEFLGVDTTTSQRQQQELPQQENLIFTAMPIYFPMCCVVQYKGLIIFCKAELVTSRSMGVYEVVRQHYGRYEQQVEYLEEKCHLELINRNIHHQPQLQSKNYYPYRLYEIQLQSLSKTVLYIDEIYTDSRQPHSLKNTAHLSQNSFNSQTESFIPKIHSPLILSSPSKLSEAPSKTKMAHQKPSKNPTVPTPRNLPLPNNFIINHINKGILYHKEADLVSEEFEKQIFNVKVKEIASQFDRYLCKKVSTPGDLEALILQKSTPHSLPKEYLGQLYTECKSQASRNLLLTHIVVIELTKMTKIYLLKQYVNRVTAYLNELSDPNSKRPSQHPHQHNRPQQHSYSSKTIKNSSLATSTIRNNRQSYNTPTKRSVNQSHKGSITDQYSFEEELLHVLDLVVHKNSKIWSGLLQILVQKYHLHEFSHILQGINAANALQKMSTPVFSRIQWKYLIHGLVNGFAGADVTVNHWIDATQADGRVFMNHQNHSSKSPTIRRLPRQPSQTSFDWHNVDFLSGSSPISPPTFQIKSVKSLIVESFPLETFKPQFIDTKQQLISMLILTDDTQPSTSLSIASNTITQKTQMYQYLYDFFEFQQQEAKHPPHSHHHSSYSSQKKQSMGSATSPTVVIKPIYYQILDRFEQSLITLLLSYFHQPPTQQNLPSIRQNHSNNYEHANPNNNKIVIVFPLLSAMICYRNHQNPSVLEEYFLFDGPSTPILQNSLLGLKWLIKGNRYQQFTQYFQALMQYCLIWTENDEILSKLYDIGAYFYTYKHPNSNNQGLTFAQKSFELAISHEQQEQQWRSSRLKTIEKAFQIAQIAYHVGSFEKALEYYDFVETYLKRQEKISQKTAAKIRNTNRVRSRSSNYSKSDAFENSGLNEEDSEGLRYSVQFLKLFLHKAQIKLALGKLSECLNECVNGLKHCEEFSENQQLQRLSFPHSNNNRSGDFASSNLLNKSDSITHNSQQSASVLGVELQIFSLMCRCYEISQNYSEMLNLTKLCCCKIIEDSFYNFCEQQSQLGKVNLHMTDFVIKNGDSKNNNQEIERVSKVLKLIWTAIILSNHHIRSQQSDIPQSNNKRNSYLKIRRNTEIYNHEEQVYSSNRRSSSVQHINLYLIDKKLEEIATLVRHDRYNKETLIKFIYESILNLRDQWLENSHTRPSFIRGQIPQTQQQPSKCESFLMNLLTEMVQYFSNDYLSSHESSVYHQRILEKSQQKRSHNLEWHSNRRGSQPRSKQKPTQLYGTFNDSVVLNTDKTPTVKNSNKRFWESRNKESRFSGNSDQKLQITQQQQQDIFPRRKKYGSPNQYQSQQEQLKYESIKTPPKSHNSRRQMNVISYPFHPKTHQKRQLHNVYSLKNQHQRKQMLIEALFGLCGRDFIIGTIRQTLYSRNDTASQEGEGNSQSLNLGWE